MPNERGPVGGAGELTFEEVRAALHVSGEWVDGTFASVDAADLFQALKDALVAKAPWQPEPGAEQLSLAYWREKLQAAEQQNIELEFRLSRAREVAKAPQGVPAALPYRLTCDLSNYLENHRDCLPKTIALRRDIELIVKAAMREMELRQAAAPKPSLPVPGPVSDHTIHHGMFPPAPSGDPMTANQMLDAILTSLKSYPNGGGDTRVMAEVDRIVREAAAPKPAPAAQDDLSPEEISGIKQGLEDVAAGRVKSLEQIEAELSAMPAPADHSRCSLCGAPRIALNRAGTLFGACTLTECEDPLHDFRVESVLASDFSSYDCGTCAGRLSASGHCLHCEGLEDATNPVVDLEYVRAMEAPFKGMNMNNGPKEEFATVRDVLNQPAPAPGAERPPLQVGDEVYVLGRLEHPVPRDYEAFPGDAKAMVGVQIPDSGRTWVHPRGVREALAAAPLSTGDSQQKQK